MRANTRANALKLRHSIELHSEGNPFTVKSPLKNLVSSALIPENAKDDLLYFSEKGQKCFEEFIHDRLLTTSKMPVWDPMKKLKLKTFSNWMKKSKVNVGEKVIKLRDERELLARFLIIQRSRLSWFQNYRRQSANMRCQWFHAVFVQLMVLSIYRRTRPV